MDRIEDRDIQEGTLGCPTCLAEYPIHHGIVEFAPAVPRAPWSDPSEADAMRLAAALGLTEARMTAVLHGAWGVQAPIMRGLSPAQLLLINPPDGVVSGDGVSIVLSHSLPVAPGTADGVAVDAAADSAMIASLRASLKPGGRMLGPTAMPVPADLMEIARDNDVWVAEAPAGVISRPVPLARRPKGLSN